MMNVSLYANTIRFFGCMMILTSCIQDPCSLMCERIATQLQECLDEWPVSWEVFEVSSEQEFSNTCKTDWAIERSVLESRALDDAYEQCSESLVYLKTNSEICAQLRGVYLIEEIY